MAIVRRFVAADETDPPMRIELAQHLLSSHSPGDHALVVGGARRAASAAPDHPGVQQKAGVLLLGAGEVPEGLAALRLAGKLEPGNPEHLVPLAEALLGSDPVEAKRILARASGLRPSGDSSMGIAACWLMMGEPELAMTSLATRPGSSRWDFPAPEIWCDVHAQLGQRPAALSVAESLRAALPLDEWKHLSALVCSYRVGEGGKGREVLRAAQKEFKDAWTARIAAFLLGDVPEADLLRLEPGLSAMDAALHRCEANYYAGILRLYPPSGVPDAAEAAALFRDSVRANGECGEELLARIELHRLVHTSPAGP
jgi:hypothetical protein